MAVDISDLPAPTKNVDISDLPSPTKGGAGSKLPRRLEIKPPEAASGEVPGFAKSIIDYATEVPNREDFSLGEAATSGGIGATIFGAGPKILEKGSKYVGKFLPAPAKPFALAGEALGKALGEIPLSKRLAIGGFGTTGGNVAEQAGELAGLPKAVTLPLSLGIGGLTGKGTQLTYDALSRLPQKEAAALVSKLTGEQSTLRAELNRLTSQLKEVPTPQRQDEINRLNAEIAKRDQALQQLKQQPKVAERKAETQAPAPTVGTQAMKPLREEVRSTKIAPALKEAETKTAVLTEAENKAAKATADAKEKIDQLDKELLANPTMDKNTFGGKLRTILEDIKKKYAPIRSEKADYAGVKTKYGDKPVVSTDSIVNLAKKDFEQSGSQAEKNFLSQIIKNLETDGKNNISVIKADSNIKTLDKMIDGFEEAGYAINKDMAIKFQKYKDMLIRQTPEEYQTARKTWQELSRPLDIVEQRTGGGLAQVLEENSLSLQDKLANAQVVGEVIKKANQGHPVLSRMLAESPDLKESARLYFAQDLFGAKIPPSETELARWIETNGNALDQLGLRSEFQNMRNAKAAAQEAVDVAKGRFNQAAHDREMAEVVRSQLQSKAKEQTRRIGETIMPEAKELPKGYQQPKTLAEKQAEAQKAKTRLESEKGKSQAEIDKINREESARMTTESNALNAEKQQIELLIGDVEAAKKSPKEVASTVASLARSMKQKGLIDDAGRQELEEAAYKLTGTIQQKAEAVAKLKRFIRYTALGTAAAVGVPYTVRQAGGGLLP